MKKTSNGWSMVGICSQWAIDEGLKPNELTVYLTILRHSFGYRRRWCYVDYNSFTITNRNTINKVITELKSRGIIHSEWTFKKNGHRNKNEYKILEPRDKIRNFEFVNNKEKQKEEEAPW